MTDEELTLYDTLMKSGKYLDAALLMLADAPYASDDPLSGFAVNIAEPSGEQIKLWQDQGYIVGRDQNGVVHLIKA